MYRQVVRSSSLVVRGVRYSHAESRIAALGLELPTPAVPKGNFVNYLEVGNLAYLSGHLPQVIYLYLCI